MLHWRCISLSLLIWLTGISKSPAQLTTLRDSMYLGFEYVYDFRFNEAKQMLDTLLTHQPDHPWCNLLGANYYWWQIVSGNDTPQMRSGLNAHADRIIGQLSPRLTELSDEDLYVLVTAYAFRSRIELLEENYVKSITRLNKAISIVKSSLGKENNSDWFYLTNGVYYYYIDYAWKHYPVLIPYLAFLPKGNTALGLSYIMLSATNSDEILSNEGHYFLLKIYYIDGGTFKDLDKGIQQVNALLQRHPGNLLYLYYKFRIQYDAGAHESALKTVEEIKNRTISNEQLSDAQKRYFIEKAAEYISGE